MTGIKYHVRWTETAENDLTGIIDYIARDSPITALEIFTQIRTLAEELVDYPERGRIVPELRKHGIFQYRELLPTPWRVMYRIEENNVYVTAVIDGRRDLETILLERLSR
jgi:plasmid stabilization system protein ParE